METKLVTCWICNGKGKVTHYLTGKQTICKYCEGSGKLVCVTAEREEHLKDK